MLFEGPIPGVRRYEGLIPGAKSDISYLSGLGVNSGPTSTYDVVAGIIDGSLYRELKAAQLEQMERNAEVAARQMDIDRMDDPGGRAQALRIWNLANEANQNAYRNLRKAIEQYNAIASYIPNTPLLSDLGIAPVALLAIGAVAVAAAILVNALAGLFRSGDAARGYLDQLASVIQATGGTISETGTAIQKTVTTIGIAAAVGIGGYFLFKFLKRRGTI